MYKNPGPCQSNHNVRICDVSQTGDINLYFRRPVATNICNFSSLYGYIYIYIYYGYAAAYVVIAQFKKLAPNLWA